MRRRTIALTIAFSALVPMVAAPAAPAAAKKRPKITKVAPMRLSVGSIVKIRGRGFSSKRRRNTVIFQASNGRAAFAKPRKATRRKLVVRVPKALATIVRGHKTTRFKLRVVVKKRFSKWTTKRLSPVVVSGAGGADGDTPGAADCGDDGDLLSRSFELGIKTDPCLKDTDGDGVDDGYEYQSALDLNHYPGTQPLPYPGKRPYPNALDPSDDETDYDGDSLELGEEFLMWVRYGTDGVLRGGYPGSLSDLLYSDGLQRSRTVAAPAAGTLQRWALDIDGNGTLWDDERDGDGDGLNNFSESHGQMLEAWWPATHDGQDEPMESKYPLIDFLDAADVRDMLADPDSDGDGVKDGADDNDHDGLTNQFEVIRPGYRSGEVFWITQAFAGDPTTWNSDAPAWGFGANPWAYTNPFNPCKPVNSDRCHAHPPIGYYQSDGLPPVGPGLNPANHPATPNG